MAVKNVSMGEDVLHDHFPAIPASEGSASDLPLKTRNGDVAANKNTSPPHPVTLSPCHPVTPSPARPAMPVLPNSLIIEGMAQTAGILVGHANDFSQKVILAKIGKATFTACAPPGFTLRFTAHIERLDPNGASTTGIVERLDPARPELPPVPLAQIELLFSHIDQNRAGLAFPEHNFVFTSQFMDLLRQSGF